MKPVAALLTAILGALAAAPAFAQEPEKQAAYEDDRSDAAALVRSLYNAVSRKEYARAWDYFGDEKPAASFEAFAEGYKDTQSVTVITGRISEEGAAGSRFFDVPVAISARSADGAENIFAGCYSARLTQPQLQEPPFRGMYLVKGDLKPAAEGSAYDALPKSCGDAPAASAQDIALDIATRTFAAAYRDICQTLGPNPYSGEPAPEAHGISFRYSYESESDPERTAHLVRFGCNSGAYNTMEVYYLVDEYGAATPLSFATPDLDIRYENDDTNDKVKSVTIIGYTGADQLVNSHYDPEQKAIFSYSKWRGIGDASSTGKWLFRNGEFTLVHYEVDASYDGEENLETILDFDTGP